MRIPHDGGHLMSTNHTVLHLLQATESTTGQQQPQEDTVWRHLEDESYLVAPAHLSTTGQPEETIIDVVGTLPAQLEGWSLLLG